MNLFVKKLESVQYKVALEITGAIQGTSHDKIYHQLGLKLLKSRRWYKNLSCMYKIMKEEVANYLINFVPKFETNIRTRNNTFNCRKNCFQYSFFCSTLNDWFNLNFNVRNSESISILKSKSLSFIHPVQTNIYIHLILTHLRLGPSHLNEHRL